MRLISQDGKIDIPYENSVVHVHAVYNYDKEKHIHVITGYRIIAPRGGDPWKLGDYSTEEKALKVMEMLQQAYIGRNEALDLDMAEGTDEEMKDIMLRQGFGTLFVTRTNINPQAEFKPLHTYFKFPADEEVKESE